MILPALLLLAQTAPPPAGTDDIVVTARRRERLKRLQMTTVRDRTTGVIRCIFKRRSGDPALGTAVCDAALTCVSKVQTMDAMRTCIAPTMDALTGGAVRWRANAVGGR